MCIRDSTGMEYGDLFGNFFFTDFCTGHIYMVDKRGNSIDFGEFEGFEYTTLNKNHLGEMFITAFSSNRILQIHSDNPSPTAFITNGTDVFICENANTGVTLGAYNLPQATHISYEWLKDGAPVAGANSPGLLVDEAGVYQVIVTNNNNGMQSTSEETIVTIGESPVVEEFVRVDIGDTFQGVVITGDTTFTRVFTSSIGCDSTVLFIINDFVNTSDLVSDVVRMSVAPNPFQGNILINLNLERAALVRLDLFDLTGKQIRSVLENTRLSQGQYSQEVDLSNLPKGTYLIRGATDDGVFVERVVKI